MRTREWWMTGTANRLALAGIQERFAGPAPRGEGQRMPSCLPPIIIVAKINVTTIVPDRTGRANGLAGPTGGPARTADGLISPYRCIIAAPQVHGQGHADAKMVD